MLKLAIISTTVLTLPKLQQLTAAFKVQPATQLPSYISLQTKSAFESTAQTDYISIDHQGGIVLVSGRPFSCLRHLAVYVRIAHIGKGGGRSNISEAT